MAALGLGVLVFGWLIWPDISPYLALWVGPRGSRLVVTYYGFPAERIIAALAVVTVTALLFYGLRSPVSPGKGMNDSAETQEGVWPPAPARPR